MYFMKFTYDEQEFDKKVGCGFSNTHKFGETISLNTQTAQTYFYLRMKTLS